MKFEHISLEKYGAISAREIDLANTAGLVVIYGANEAGKSTLLCAIRDLLFGVPHTSPHGAIFGNNQMRIGATLHLADGSKLVFRRKKGRSPGDLVDGNNNQIPAEQMGAILAGMDRDRFGALFGLDHVSLREGGQKLLASDGEIGRLIVEAGGGLRALVKAMAELEEEADRLFSSNKSLKRRFYPALDEFQVADREVKHATTTREAFLKAQKAAQSASNHLEALREEQRGAREMINRLTRTRRTAPQFQLMAQTEDALIEYSDIEGVPDSVAIEVPEALAARTDALDALAISEQALSGLQSELDKLTLASDIVEAAEEINAAEALAIHVEKARLDLPNRLTDMAESQSQLAQLRAHLGLGDDVDLQGRAPGRSVIEEVQSLASRAIALKSSLQSAKDQLAEYQDSLHALREMQSGREAKGFDKPAPVSAADLVRLPALARDLDLQGRQFAEKHLSIRKEAEKLGLDPAEFSGGLWPSTVEVNRERERQAGIEAELRQARGAHTAAERRNGQAAKRIAELSKGTLPPTPAAIAEARASRDAVWQDIRAVYFDASEGDWNRPPRDQRSEVASNYEQGVSAADDLADRGRAEAQRLADIAAAEREKFAADEETKACLQQIEALEQLLTESQRAWQKSWPDAYAMASGLPRLVALTEARESLIEKKQELVLQRTSLEELKEEVESLGTLLDRVRLVSPSSPSGSIAVSVQAAVASLKVHDSQYTNYLRDADEIAKLAAKEEKQKQAIEGLVEQQTQWRERWSKAVEKLGLTKNAEPQLAMEVATEWASAPGTFNAIRLTQTRIKRIKEDDQKLSGDIAALRERLGIELPDDAVAAARHLKRLLEEFSAKRAQRDALAPRYNQAKLDFETVKQRVQAADAALADLASKCRCDVARLEELARRVEVRRTLHLKLESIAETIVTAGDGLSLTSLREEWQLQDPDEVVAQLVELEDAVLRREGDIETAISNKQISDADVQAFVDDDRLNDLIAEREMASAEMHQIIERYVEISLALSLLKAAIEKVRHEQQDPLLARASELFSACTRGEFSGIGTDVSGDGEPVVVGLRQGGDSVGLSEMSDGTRDQLFLAFRLASIEHYAENAEPIPFIADDVLVHFDDDRGKAALEILAAVGFKTQVLLFTHHASVKAAAAALVSEGRATVIAL